MKRLFLIALLLTCTTFTSYAQEYYGITLIVDQVFVNGVDCSEEYCNEKCFISLYNHYEVPGLCMSEVHLTNKKQIHGPTSEWTIMDDDAPLPEYLTGKDTLSFLWEYRNNTNDESGVASCMLIIRRTEECDHGKLIIIPEEGKMIIFYGYMTGNPINFLG